MSYNGSGTFLINSAGQPVVANTVISATVFNALTSDLATGLSTAITKDGQTTITANIPFGSNKITGLGSGTAATDAANLGQVQSTAAKLITVTGTDTITGSMSPALTAYAAGQLFYFVSAGANTGPVTINIDSLGAKAITRDGATALANGDINSGEVVVVIYDGTRFQMINAANSFGNTTINGTLTVTGNTGLQANVSITSTLSVGGTFAVTGAATLGSTLAVTGKSDLPTVSTASINAAVALITTGTVTNLTASGASIASANIGNLQFTAASIASINAGVAVITNLTATGASIASMNAGVALLTTATVTSLTATGASVASANVGTAVVTGLTVTNASIASLNAGTATVTTGNLTFSSTAQRITGDMTGAFANRLAFQTSTTNGNTILGILANGTPADLAGTGVVCNAVSDTTNTQTMSMFVFKNLEASLRSNAAGTGTYLPMTFYTGGSERMRLDTSGNLLLNTSAAAPAGFVSPGVLYRSANSGAVWSQTTSSTNSVGFRAVVDDYDSSFTNTSLIQFGSAQTGTTYGIANADLGSLQFTNVSNAVIGTNFANLIFATSSAERMRIDSSGNVGIGGTAAAFSKLAIAGTLPTSSNLSVGLDIVGTIPSGTTSGFDGVLTRSVTAAAAFTLTNLHNFRATQGTLGAGSTVTNQYGFVADSSLTGATNNFGFYSNIASAANRWNFYAAGTAQNYFAGNVGIGRSPSYRLDVEQTADAPTARIVANQSAFLSSNQAVLFIEVNNGTPSSTSSFSIIADYNGAEQFKVRNDGTIYAQNTTVQSISDVRVKENVRDAVEGLSVINALRPVRFDFKKGFGNNRKNQLGFIAQEVEAIFPDAVDVAGEKDDNGDPYKSVGPAALIPVLVKAIQELTARVAELEAK